MKKIFFLFIAYFITNDGISQSCKEYEILNKEIRHIRDSLHNISYVFNRIEPIPFHSFMEFKLFLKTSLSDFKLNELYKKAKHNDGFNFSCIDDTLVAGEDKIQEIIENNEKFSEIDKPLQDSLNHEITKLYNEIRDTIEFKKAIEKIYSSEAYVNLRKKKKLMTRYYVEIGQPAIYKDLFMFSLYISEFPNISSGIFYLYKKEKTSFKLLKKIVL